MKARIETVARTYFGAVNDRLLKSAFGVDPLTMEQIWTKYGNLFSDISELAMFLNYAADCSKNDELFACRWKRSRQSLKPKITSILHSLHTRIDEVCLPFFKSERTFFKQSLAD
jgi:hypothetical protein